MKTLHKRCAAVDVHKAEVVACLRLVTSKKVEREVRRVPTTTPALLELTEWLEEMHAGREPVPERGTSWHSFLASTRVLAADQEGAPWLKPVLVQAACHSYVTVPDAPELGESRRRRLGQSNLKSRLPC
jgi:hypothetical protein